MDEEEEMNQDLVEGVLMIVGTEDGPLMIEEVIGIEERMTDMEGKGRGLMIPTRSKTRLGPTRG